MKICVTGAGSSRLPLMMASIAQHRGTIDEISLFDIRPERIKALMPVGEELCAYLGRTLPFKIASSFEDAVEGSNALILTIRPGFEEQRAEDERACLSLGILGQETTGPAGLAFATRTIPAVSRYCAIARKLAPECLPVVFTNPAGLVTQALHDQGFSNAIGICDSATVAARKIAARTGVMPDDIDFEVSGLNHLSWTRRVEHHGFDLMTPAINDDGFMKTLVPWLTDRLRPGTGIPVEYLFYYLRPGEAVTAILAEPETRGEALVRTNAALFSGLSRSDRETGVIGYASYLFNRNDTYMSYALGHRHSGGGPDTRNRALDFLAGETGGYAEVAMELLASSQNSADRVMALNVRNGGAIQELADDDVVETDCTVSGKGIQPRRHGPMPAAEADLVLRVKEYERLSVKAILKSMKNEPGPARALATDALTAHPLVPDRETASKLVHVLRLFDKD